MNTELHVQSTNTKNVQSQLFIDLVKWLKEEVQNDPVKTKELEKILQKSLTPCEPSSLIAHAGERKRKTRQIFDYDSEN